MTGFSYAEVGRLPLERGTAMGRLLHDAPASSAETWQPLPDGSGVVIHTNRPERRPGGLASTGETRILLEPTADGVLVRMSVAMTFNGRHAWAIRLARPFARLRVRRAHRALMKSLLLGDVAPLEQERLKNVRSVFRTRRALVAAYAVMTIPLLALVALISWLLALLLAVLIGGATASTLIRVGRAQRRSIRGIRG